MKFVKVVVTRHHKRSLKCGTVTASGERTFEWLIFCAGSVR